MGGPSNGRGGPQGGNGIVGLTAYLQTPRPFERTTQVRFDLSNIDREVNRVLGTIDAKFQGHQATLLQLTRVVNDLQQRKQMDDYKAAIRDSYATRKTTPTLS
jgi:hypothetical protein